jgi:hypothetical protein
VIAKVLKPRQEESVTKNTTIAIDLAKSVFEIGISDRPGHVAEKHRLSRGELATFLAAQPPGDRRDGSL